MRRLNSHFPRSPMSSLATFSPDARITNTQLTLPRPLSAVQVFPVFPMAASRDPALHTPVRGEEFRLGLSYDVPRGP